MPSSSTSQWALLVVLTALCLSLLVLLQAASSHAAAYFAAPREAAALADAVDSSVRENEGLERDAARAPRLEDKLRLGRLLREVQRGGDELREDLGRLLAPGAPPRLTTPARLLWASRRAALEDKLRRLDMLRMRFLVIYMGIVAAGLAKAEKDKDKDMDRDKDRRRRSPARDPEKQAAAASAAASDGLLGTTEPARPSLPWALTDSIKVRTPLRRLTTQSMGHNEKVEGNHRQGWAGVVQELQRSPLMQRRHASIETAMSRTP